MNTCLKIGLWLAAHAHRRTAQIAQNACQASHGHTYQIGSLVFGIWSGLSKRGNGGQDDIGLYPLKLRISQAQHVHISRGKGFNHKIRGLNQFLEYSPAIRSFDIQSYASFAGVGGKPEEAFLRVGDILIEGALVTGRIAFRFLNLDHICTKVAQDLPA